MASPADEEDSGDTTQEGIAHWGPFSDPVFRQLSRINGEINKMTCDELKGRLRELKLDSRGNKEVLKRRMKNHYKKVKLANSKIKDPQSLRYYQYFCVIDFEATCEAQNSPNYKHEIIEFPAVLVNVEEKKIVCEFHQYCRPLINQNLSSFCSELTGITQDIVTKALPFPEVLKKFEAWLKDNKLGTTHSFAIVTDGPWDMGRFLVTQCEISKLKYPWFARKWVNIRKVFTCFYQSNRLNLQQMLDFLGLTFEGRPHCGLDDTRNIARILIHLLNDGANVRINERVKLPNNDSSSNRCAVLPVTRREFQSSRQKSVRWERRSNFDDSELSQNVCSDDEEDDEPVDPIDTEQLNNPVEQNHH